MRARDRIAAWVLTGPVGRVVAFIGDLGAALGGWAVRRMRSQPTLPIDPDGSASDGH